MKKPYLLLIAVAALVAFGAGCGKNTNKNTNADDQVVNQGLDLNEALDLNVTNADETNTNDTLDTNASLDLNTNDSVTTNSNLNTNVNTSTTNTNTNTSITSTSTIKLTGPVKDAELVSPFYVEGTVASGTEVYARLKASGATIFTEKISVHSKAFRGKLLFDFSRTTSGTIEVFQKDASGAETNLTSVDVRFKLGTTANSNSNTNSSTNTNS